MEITRSVNDGIVELVVVGRLDGYWADHLDAALTDAIREGHHRLRLDCSQVSFLSSAGIGVLVKFHKELARINGSFSVVNPSKPVSTALRITRLIDVLVGPARADDAVAALERPARRIERDGAGFDVYDLAARTPLTCRTVGSAAPLSTGAFADEHCVTLESLSPAFAIGVGAFGDTFADCRTRFGELISVAGATAYQPADGTNVADYLVAKGPLGSDIRLLYGLACDGAFAHLVRFEAVQQGAAVTPSHLAAACLTVCDAAAIGLVIVAETAGMVGAALRRSPAAALNGGAFFAHPSVRTRLMFTAERAFTRTVCLAAGVVSRSGEGAG